MQAFIDMAVSQLGISSDDAQTATGGIMSLIQDQLEKSEFSQVESAIPGVGDMISQFSGGSGGGLLGGLASAIGGSGGALGSAATLATLLSKTSLDSGQLGQFGEMLISFLKENAGEFVAGKLDGLLPSLLSDAA